MEDTTSGAASSVHINTHQKVRKQHGVNGLRASEKMLNVLLGFLKVDLVALNYKKRIDNMFFTCCILRNMLLPFDGLANRWENNVNWAGKDGEHSGEDIAIFRNHNR